MNEQIGHPLNLIIITVLTIVGRRRRETHERCSCEVCQRLRRDERSGSNRRKHQSTHFSVSKHRFKTRFLC